MASDNQTSVEVHVLQGERQMASDNKTLGKFQMYRHPGCPSRRAAESEVTFAISTPTAS